MSGSSSDIRKESSTYMYTVKQKTLASLNFGEKPDFIQLAGFNFGEKQTTWFLLWLKSDQRSGFVKVTLWKRTNEVFTNIKNANMGLKSYSPTVHVFCFFIWAKLFLGCRVP